MKTRSMSNISFWVIFAVVLFSGWDDSRSLGQIFDQKPMLAEGYTDFFSKNVNELAYKNVKNVNHFHLKPAIKLMRAGKPERAIPDLQFILRWVPNHPTGLSLMATVCQMIQRPNLAIPFFNQAISLFPQHGLTYAQYGKLLYDLKKNEKAKDFLNKAITLDSKLGVAYGWLSLVHHSEGAIDLSKKAAKKAKGLGYKGPFPKG